MAFLRSVAARFAQRYYAKRHLGLAAGCRRDQAEGRGIVRAQADSVRRAAFKDETAGLLRAESRISGLTYIRKDGNRFPAVVSVTALRDAQNAAATSSSKRARSLNPTSTR